MIQIVCLPQITEGTDGQSMEAVSEPPASVDVGDPERVCEASSRPCERAEKENPVVGEKEGERNESQPEEPEIKDTGLVLGCEPGSSSDSEKEDGVEVKAEEEFETNEERVAIKDGCSEDGPAGPDASEDTDMHETTCEALAITEDTETKESVNAEADVCMLRVCAAADLDEMMDIGTVDQVEQEAQMKEEQQPNEMDTDNSRSPSPVNRGRVKHTFNQSRSIQGFPLQRNISNLRVDVKSVRCCDNRTVFFIFIAHLFRVAGGNFGPLF